VSIDRGSHTLYSYAPVENGPHEIGRFPIDSRILTTKFWDGYGVAWEEIKDEKSLSLLFEKGEPIGWEMVKEFPRMQRY